MSPILSGRETHNEDIRLVEEAKSGYSRRNGKRHKKSVSMPLPGWME